MEVRDIINQCIAQNPRAQESLYYKYATKMFRIVYRYVNELDEAEDILSKGFIKVFNNLNKFEYRGEKSLDAWVKRIMINEALMSLRKNKQYYVDASKAYDLSEKETAEHKLHLEDIYNCVKMMPIGYRTVFNMYVIEGYSHKEIATLLEVSVNTSKSQLSKGKKWLRNYLLQKGITDEI